MTQPPFIEQPWKLQMQSPLHTPGPWRSHGAGGEIHGNSRIVATMCWCSGMHDEDEANARLIAAAPDMLAALYNVRKLISEAAMTGFNCKDGDWAERLFASQAVTSDAINKATRG
jgi:hypothetical protein